MNIFLSKDNVVGSLQDLDDLRLQKQLVEAYQLLTLAIKEQEVGHEVKAGHYHHPVYLFYKNNPKFLCYYGYIACQEYKYRFNKTHKLFFIFQQLIISKFADMVDLESWKVVQPAYSPYYMEGSLGQPNYIRTTEGVSGLFRAKLINKWQADKAKGRNPKWTNREMPEFYKKYLKDLEG